MENKKDRYEFNIDLINFINKYSLNQKETAYLFNLSVSSISLFINKQRPISKPTLMILNRYQEYCFQLNVKNKKDLFELKRQMRKYFL